MASPVAITGLSSTGVYDASATGIVTPGINSPTTSTSDVYWNSVVSLLQLNSSLADARLLTWTAQGNAAISGGKLVLDGAGDGLLTPQSAQFNWGTNDFTIEGFVNFSSVAGTQYLFGSGTNIGTGNLYVAWNAGVGKLRVVMNNAGVIVDQTWSPSAGVDYHIEITRVGGKIYHFVNGVKLGTEVVDATNINALGAQMGVGIGTDASNSVNGSVWGVRYTNGVGRHSAAFTPPSFPLPTTDGQTDPYFSNVVALLYNQPFANTTTALVDAKGHIFTPTGNAQNSTSGPPTGLASYRLFDGTGDYDTTPDSADWVLNAGNWTIECYFNPSSNPAGQHLVWNQWGIGAQHSNYLSWSGSGILEWIGDTTLTGSGYAVTIGTGLSTGVWRHVAVCNNGGTITTWLNGAAGGTTTPANMPPDSANPMQLGGWSATGGFDFPGGIAGFRWTKGVARYTAAFTPPTLPLPSA